MRRAGTPLRRSGFFTLELLLFLALMSAVLTVTVRPFRTVSFQAKVRDAAFMGRLKGAVLTQRMRCVKEPGVGYNFILDGSGSVRFQRQGSTYLRLDDETYRVHIQKGVWSKVETLEDFTSWIWGGTDGFTLSVYRKERLMGKLVFQIVTSTFREEYYGPF